MLNKLSSHDNRKEHYTDLNYIQMMKRFVWWTGFWPGEALGEKVPLFVRWHKIQMMLQNIWGFVGQVTYIVVFFDQISFLDAGILYITASVTFMMLVRFLSTEFTGYDQTFN